MFWFSDMESKTFYGKQSTSTIVEDQEDDILSEIKFSEGKIFDPSGESSAEDTYKLSDDVNPFLYEN